MNNILAFIFNKCYSICVPFLLIHFISLMQTIQKARGYLKFKVQVSLTEIQNFAKELAQDPRFLSVYIRQVSKDQFGIGFISDVDTPDNASFQNFSEELKDQAMKKFGVGFAGWDITRQYDVIK